MRAVALLLLLVLGATGVAGDLTCGIPVSDLRLRRGGPIPVEMELTNRSNHIVEGYLEATILHRGKRIGVHRTAELALIPGRRSVPMLLPPPPDPDYGEGLAIRLHFIRADGVESLGDFQLGQYPPGGMEFVIATIRTDRRITTPEILRERSVRLENLRPALEARAWFNTTTVPISSERLPTTALGWCAYDVVWVDSAAFRAVTQKQLEAMEQWLRAGGSALFIAEGPLKESQVRFLRSLASDREAVVALDDQEHLLSATPLRISPGLGRALVVGKPPASDAELDRGDWRAHVGWLWKLRPGLLGHVENHGVWPADRPGYQEDWWGDERISLEGWLRTRGINSQKLETDRPRPLPLGTVALLLGGLLLMAGPVDWFVLGWLRRHRWTWVVFPLLCLACAWAASRLATRFLGSTGREAAIRIIDFGPRDRLLRETSMELRFPAHDEVWLTETSDGLSLPLLKTAPRDDFAELEKSRNYPEFRSAWTVPSKFALRQNVQQWTPQWRQSFRFPTELEEAGPDWTALIRAWKQWQKAPNTILPREQGEFTIYYRPSEEATTADTNQFLPLESRIPRHIADALFQHIGPLSDILSHQSPVILGPSRLALEPQGALAILAWRADEGGLHIFRRHVSQQEVDKSP
jgi:hypothetical protein